MVNNNNQGKYPLSIYAMVYTYAIIAILIIYRTFSSFHFSQINIELIVIALLLIIFRRWPIIYKVNNNRRIQLAFNFPIVLIFTIIPIILSELTMLFYPSKKMRNMPAFKRLFNFSNTLISIKLASDLFHYLSSLSIFSNNYMIIAIILSAIIYSSIHHLSVSVVVYLEKRTKFSMISINIFVSNIMNGIITYYLYQSLGLLGIFIAISYAILFSYRSHFHAKYEKMRDELSEAEQRFSKIFNTIDYGIIMLDLKKRIKMANPVALQFLQTFANEPTGKRIIEIVEDIPKELKDIVDWTYENKRNYSQKKIFIHINQREVYLDFYTYPYNITEEEFAGIILLYKNVTDELLIRKQLIEADKLSHIGQIAAGKVHEIKNPLATVRGYLQFLKHKIVKGDEINLNNFDIALQEIDRTNELISSLLILSKASNHNVRATSIDKVLEEVIHLFEYQMFVRSITFTREIIDDLYILGNENHLKQIFINLMLNAIDAVSNHKSPMITVTAGIENNEVVITISDNGVGINTEDIEKLKVPFFTTKESGTGLGLSVTYKLVAEHKGRIEVNSKLQEGTTFKIILPVIDELESRGGF